MEQFNIHSKIKEKVRNFLWCFPGGSVIKNPPSGAGDAGLIPGSGLLEEEVATHSNILVWKIPCTEEPGGLKFMGLQRVGHSFITEHGARDFLYICCPYTPQATLPPPITVSALWATCYSWWTCMDTLASCRVCGYIRIHPWCCIFWGFGQIYNDVYPSS